MLRILVVEDEAAIASAIGDRLRAEGFIVDIAHDGIAGIEACRASAPDLVVLDLNLPGRDGLSVCKELQSERHVPVLMVTARADESDLLVGLAVGADDYMTKPFSMKELAARVHAILRRTAATSESRATIAWGRLDIDESKRTVTASDGEIVHLTPLEFDLLVVLVRGAGKVFSRDRLLFEVWGYREAGGGRTIDSHVRSLRRKLGDGYVRTVHGVGYAAEVPA